MNMTDETMSENPIEIHLQNDILPNVFIDTQKVEFVTGSAEENRYSLWEALGPSLDILIEKFQLPEHKPDVMTDDEYFELLIDRMYEQNMAVKGQDKELIKWSVWASVANETGATNCSLGTQVVLRLLENAGYEVEYGTPGPLTHSIAFAKSGEAYYYIDPTNGIVERVSETTEVDGIKVHVMKTDNFKCPFEAVPAFPPEYSVVATISNLQALQSENGRPVHSEFVTKLAARFNIVNEQNYIQWVTQNLFPDWIKLTKSEFWNEETAKVDKKLSTDVLTSQE